MSTAIKAAASIREGRAAVKKNAEHFKADNHFWVGIEQGRGDVHPISWELMGADRKLAGKLKVDVAAVALRLEREAMRNAARASSYGADMVYADLVYNVQQEHRKEFYTKALIDAVNSHRPTILPSRTTFGCDLTGSVTATLLAGSTSLPCTIYKMNRTANGHRTPARDGNARARHARSWHCYHLFRGSAQSRPRRQNAIVYTWPRIR